MQISFGMIFSIILVILFLVLGFYVIQKFLGMQSEIQIRTFTEDFQNDINKMHTSTSGSKVVEYTLPKKVEQICILDEEFDNMELRFKDRGRYSFDLKYVDTRKSTGEKGVICGPVVENKIKFQLKKEYGDTLVTVKV